VVDSDTLPLSVSRETLQAHASLKTIKKKIVRKLLDMFKKMADAEQEVAGAARARYWPRPAPPPACRACAARCGARGRARAGAPRRARRARAARAGKEDAEDDAERAGAGAYAKFYAEFGKAVKLGIIEDPPNRNRLAKLLRFHTSKSGDKMIGLDEYVARMQPDQKQIYYLSGARARPPAAPTLAGPPRSGGSRPHTKAPGPGVPARGARLRPRAAACPHGRGRAGAGPHPCCLPGRVSVAPAHGGARPACAV